MTDILHAESTPALTCERLEVEAVFSELTDDAPAELTFYTLKTLPNGQQLPYPQTVQVLEAGLLQRLRRLSPGAKIRVCVETDWASADIPTVLKACTLLL